MKRKGKKRSKRNEINECGENFLHPKTKPVHKRKENEIDTICDNEIIANALETATAFRWSIVNAFPVNFI